MLEKSLFERREYLNSLGLLSILVCALSCNLLGKNDLGDNGQNIEIDDEGTKRPALCQSPIDSSGICQSNARDLGSPLPCPIDIEMNALETGQVVGNVTENSARIWIDPKNGSKVKVKFRTLGKCDEQYTEGSTLEAAGDMIFAEFRGLCPNTNYEYVITSEDKVAGGGSFTTPCPAGPTKFRYLFGSCMRDPELDLDGKKTRVWADMKNISPSPSLLILNGDTVYHNTGNYKAIIKENRIQRRVPDFRYLIANIPTITTWDDHDFGKNNGSSSFSGKKGALEAWSHLWPNAILGEEVQKEQQIYYTSLWGDIEYFFVDNRYFRVSGTYLGKKQMSWLISKLKESSAVFKVIVHGGTLRRAGSESWFERSKSERDQLLGALRGQDGGKKITGVIFHGGDVHKNVTNPYPKCLGTGATYQAFEIVSSGLTLPKGSRGGRWTIVDVDTSKPEPQLTYTFVSGGKDYAKGIISLLSDGRLKHEWDENLGDPQKNNQDIEFVFSCPNILKGPFYIDP